MTQFMTQYTKYTNIPGICTGILVYWYTGIPGIPGIPSVKQQNMQIEIPGVNV
jgi:hypothetical protein